MLVPFKTEEGANSLRLRSYDTPVFECDDDRSYKTARDCSEVSFNAEECSAIGWYTLRHSKPGPASIFTR